MHSLRACLIGAAVAIVLVGAPMLAKDDSHGWNISIGADTAAQAKDVGLPVYPGAVPRKDKDESSARVWALLNSAGLKVAVMKLATDDSPEKVAAFYRPALAKYGQVLDCTGRSSGARVGDKDDKLDCSGDKPEPGERLFKAGKNRDQHVVAIRPRGHGSEIDLVFVRISGFE